MQCVVSDGCRESAPDGLGLCRGHWMSLPLFIRELYWGVFGDAQLREDQADKGYDEAVKQAESWMDDNTVAEEDQRIDPFKPDPANLYKHLSMLEDVQTTRPRPVFLDDDSDTISVTPPANSGGPSSERTTDGPQSIDTARWDDDGGNARPDQAPPENSQSSAGDAGPIEAGRPAGEVDQPGG